MPHCSLFVFHIMNVYRRVACTSHLPCTKITNWIVSKLSQFSMYFVPQPLTKQWTWFLYYWKKWNLLYCFLLHNILGNSFYLMKNCKPFMKWIIWWCRVIFAESCDCVPIILSISNLKRYALNPLEILLPEFLNLQK